MGESVGSAFLSMCPVAASLPDDLSAPGSELTVVASGDESIALENGDEAEDESVGSPRETCGAENMALRDD